MEPFEHVFPRKSDGVDAHRFVVDGRKATPQKQMDILQLFTNARRPLSIFRHSV
jgi:hypothetical protein